MNCTPIELARLLLASGGFAGTPLLRIAPYPSPLGAPASPDSPAPAEALPRRRASILSIESSPGPASAPPVLPAPADARPGLALARALPALAPAPPALLAPAVAWSDLALFIFAGDSAKGSTGTWAFIGDVVLLELADDDFERDRERLAPFCWGLLWLCSTCSP